MTEYGDFKPMVATIAGTPGYVPSLSQTTGTVPVAQLGTGTPSASTVLLGNGTWGAANVPGMIIVYAAATAPLGWLLCDGTSYSTASPSSLFAAIGYTYGGAGANFNVPDLRGRVVIMVDGGAGRITSTSLNGGNASAIAGVGGFQAATLTATNIPALTVTHTCGSGAGGSTFEDPIVTTGVGVYQNSITETIGFYVNASPTSHSNTQPWMALQYIIKT